MIPDRPSRVVCTDMQLRRTLALALCLPALALAACGGDDDSDSGDRPGPASATTPATTATPEPVLPAGLGNEIRGAIEKAGKDPKKAEQAVRDICRREAAKIGGSQGQAIRRICEGQAPDPAETLQALPEKFRKRAVDALKKARTDPQGALRDARKICEDAAADLDGGAAATARQACATIPTAP